MRWFLLLGLIATAVVLWIGRIAASVAAFWMRRLGR